MSTIDRIVAQARAEMEWRLAAHMHRLAKDTARRLLAGQPVLDVRPRPVLIARRYIRRLAYLRRRLAGRPH